MVSLNAAHRIFSTKSYIRHVLSLCFFLNLYVFIQLEVGIADLHLILKKMRPMYCNYSTKRPYSNKCPPPTLLFGNKIDRHGTL